MNIISHRGAGNLAPENSKQAIIMGSSIGANYVEFDVQKTADDYLVIIHNTKTPNGKEVANTIFSDIKNELPNIITLKEALHICKPSPALIELKSGLNTANLILPLIINYPSSAITTFYVDQLKIIKNKQPDTVCFLMQRKHPFGLIKKAVGCNADGIAINKIWLLLLPLIANKAKQRSLKLFIYTINSRQVAKIINRFYKDVLICTDNPKKIRPNEA